MLNVSRRWTNADAVVVARRDALGDALGEPYPFTAALVEGPRCFRAQDLVAMAVAAGASRSAVSRDQRAAVRHVRDAFSRGDLLAFRRPGPGEGAAAGAGSILVQGSFTIEPTAHGTLGAHEERHRRLAQLWWTTEKLREIAARVRFALSLVLPGQVSHPEIRRRVGRQVVAIRDFLMVLHEHEQESALDGATAPPPRFRGLLVR